MGGSNYTPTAFNLRAPVLDKLVDPAGVATPLFQRYLTNLTQLIANIGGIQVVPSGSDITSALQLGINQAIRQGGGVVVLPAGSYTISSVSTPVNSPPISIVGQGWATKLTRSVALAAGVGIIDISSSYVSLSDFILDGGTTVPVGLQYSSGFVTPISQNDPMAPSLTTNTSVWVHGPASNISIHRVLFQHAGGYSVLLDATTGDISDVDIVQCWLYNNRPTLFGTNPTQLIYGSWNGGIFAKGDGRSASGAESGMVSRLLVESCRFARNTGNCLWSHAYGFDRFHSEFRYADNNFLDCGLDGILVDVVSGGSVEGNVMRRVGYVCTDDTSQSVPRWLTPLNATGLDSGVVKGVNYLGNSFTSVNGGMIDLDTHGLGSISGNICRIPYADEPEYTEDQIAITGPNNNGNGSYGLNLAVNYPVNEGGEYLTIVANTLLNLPAGAMRLYASRYCLVEANTIDAPDNSTYAPIQLGPNGANSYNRCYGNKITGNQVRYSPATNLPVVLEDDSLSGGHPMTGGEANSVYNNNPINPAGSLAVEFQKAAGSGSVVYLETIWFT